MPYLFGQPVKVDRDNFYGLPDNDYQKTRVNIGTLRLDHEFNEHLKLRSTLRYANYTLDQEATAPRIAPTRRVGVEDDPDLVAHVAKDGELFVFSAVCVSRVVEGPVMAVQLAREPRTCLVRLAADGDHGFDRLVEEFAQVF